MAFTSNQLTVSYSASSPAIWDVFLSFYGKDTRRNFVANLYFALNQAGISTFRDDPELEKGQEISSGLLTAIRDTNMFVVVISENYATSSWCLDELVEILSCKKTKNQVVPVFYYVDPSNLRHHKGSFGEALDHHIKHNNYNVNTIDKWKSALAEIAELAGYHLKQDANENESHIVQQIVDHVTSQTSTKVIHLEKDLVGIDSAVEEIYQKLQMDSNDVRAIGICGMGGIGKTTTAKAFYNRYSSVFDISCFIENVKQYSHGGSPLLTLLQQILSELLRRKNYTVSDVKAGIRQLEHVLYSKKALIILDDLDQSSHLEWLAMLCKMFSAGSRIVITTRDVYLLNQLKVDISEVDIYMMKEMEENDALELFSCHAFREPMPPESFRELSFCFVTYAGGLPLALKVLGSSLRGRTELSFWRAKLEKVVKFPENDILKILRLSYDELADETEKQIFLDIVFFFVGKNKDEAVHIFRSCDFFPDVGIPRLIDRCLLTVSSYNTLEMHNLIQDMGKEVIGKESKHGNCRRLHLSQRNACEELENLEGTNKIESIILNATTWAKRKLIAKIFEKMRNLSLLEIIGVEDLQGSFANSFHELRCIRWRDCPWTQLPFSFHPQKLVSLDMPSNNFKILMKDTKILRSLKILNLRDSRKLKKTPDFTDMKMIEKLDICHCVRLQKVHPSIGKLCYLTVLDLSGCTKLKELPETMGELTKLTKLYLCHCVNLKRLPEQLGDMKGLKIIDATNTALEQLPDSICQLKELSSLNLWYCKKLRKLPEQLGDMKGLRMLVACFTAIEQLPDSICELKALSSLFLYGCKKLRKLREQFGNMEGLKDFYASGKLEELPDSIGGLINLAKLKLDGCKNLTTLPDSICKLKLLKQLHLRSCSKLERLPEQLGMMHSLESIDASDTAIQELPDSVKHLSKLQSLNLTSCKKLKQVPNSIWNLPSLTILHLPKEVTFRSNFPDHMVENNMNKLENLSLKCNIRLQLPTILRLSLGQSLSSSSSIIWASLSKLSNLEYLALDNWGSSFLQLPPNLTDLRLHNHATLKEVPDLPNLEHLKTLHILNCISLQSLPPLPLNLESVFVDRCTNLKSVDLKPCHLQAQPLNYNHYFALMSDLPNSDVAAWFDYKSSGSTISFKIPSSVLEDDLLGIALWVVFKNKYCGEIAMWITNKTEGIKGCYRMSEHTSEQVQSKVARIGRYTIPMKSGDRMKVSFYTFIPNSDVIDTKWKAEKCGAHVVLKANSTP